MAENPYNEKKEEGSFHSWQAGYGASSEMECPYSNDDGPLLTSWMQGHRAKLKEIGAAEPEIPQEKPKPASQKPQPKKQPQATPTPQKTISLEDFSSEDLEKELNKRKLFSERNDILNRVKEIHDVLLKEYGIELDDTFSLNDRSIYPK